MATVSSHVLDAIQGCSAKGIRITLEQINSTGDTPSRHVVFDVHADDEGRISESVNTDASTQYELVFYAADYFKGQGTHPDGRQIIEQAVVRLRMPDPNERYHIPMIVSPHSQSLWWSE